MQPKVVFGCGLPGNWQRKNREERLSMTATVPGVLKCSELKKQDTSVELSLQNYRTLLDLIHRVHTAPDIKSLFRSTWETLRDSLEITTGAFMPVDPDTGHFLVEGYEVFDLHPQFVTEYVLRFSPMDPILSYSMFRNFFNDAVRLSDCVSHNWVETSDYANDFLKRAQISHILASNLGCDGKSIGVLRLHRQDRDRCFTEHDMMFLKLLAPHLSQAIKRFHQNAQVNFTPKTGFVVIHRNGSTFWGNRMAKSILKDRPIEHLLSSATENPSIIHTHQGTFKVRTLQALPPKDGDFSHPESDQVLILLLEPFAVTRSIRERLSSMGFSPRQAEITALILQGKSNRIVASDLGISEQTVKDHLRDIFNKFGLESRYQLIFHCLNAL
ncbi:MAG: LuxR C-terminal-related transcriptional regulator [Leptospirales bacterium]